MKKLILILTMAIFLVGIVSAEEYAGTINNISGIYIDNFTAGTITTANFSYDYLDYYGDKQYPHILKINITSENQEDYPVWKNDFELSGFVRKYTFFGMFHTDTGLKCSEENPLTINHPLGSNTLDDVPNGTFYCYNETSEAIDDLSKHDEVFLTIGSHPALWPGQYTLSAMIYYLEDTLGPVVNILNKADFDQYFNVGNAFTIGVTIEDNIEVKANSYGAIVYNGSEELFSFGGYESGGNYYFPWTVPSNMAEGDYPLKIFAEDTSNNTGNDSVTLKIDLTAPEIVAIQPDGSIYDEIIPVELSVTDAKAGVDNQSVYYRLREMDGTSVCPESGIGTWDCYNSGWVQINLAVAAETYQTEIDITGIELESGEYWFEAKAKDILGNEGILE